MKRPFFLFLTALFLASVLAPFAAAGNAAAPVRGYVALTFDDGPSGEITRDLLEVLRAREVKATFFVCAYRIAQYPDELRMAAQQKHEIGLHSCRHSYMNRMTYDEVSADITECMQSVFDCCGVRATLFRPPGGLYSEALTDAARDAGLPVILWSVDPEDWNPVCKRDIAAAVCGGATPGAILLLHDLYPHTVRAVGTIIDRLRSEGYEFCTVSELAAYYGCPLDPGAVYTHFSP